MNLNHVVIAGNLTRNPDLKYTPKGTAICEIGVAVNRVYTTGDGEKREEVNFFNVELWGKTAEIVGKHFSKGRAIYIEGRLKLDSWEDKQSGEKRYKMRIIGDSFQFVGKKGDYGEGEEESATRPPRRESRREAPKRQEKAKDPDLDPDVPFEEEDDVPF